MKNLLIYLFIFTHFSISCFAAAEIVVKSSKKGDTKRTLQLKEVEPVDVTTKVLKTEEQVELETKNSVEKKDGSAKIAQNSDSGLKAIEHTVGPKETYYAIARQYGIPPKDLMEFNKDGDVLPDLKVGSKVKVPSAQNAPQSLQNAPQSKIDEKDQNLITTKTYTVQTGDTLTSIARRSQTSLDEIAKLNSLSKDSQVKIGDILIIKKDDDVVHETKTSVTYPCELPFLKPVESSKYLYKYGELKTGSKNEGTNIAVNEGTDVVASEAGTVIYSGKDIKEYGKVIIIKHKNNWFTVYAHLSETLKDKKEKVERGDVIAKSGSSGSNVQVPQLFFSIRKLTQTHDPQTCFAENK